MYFSIYLKKNCCYCTYFGKCTLFKFEGSNNDSDCTNDMNNMQCFYTFNN